MNNHGSSARSLWLFGLTLAAFAGCGGTDRAGMAYAVIDFRIFDLADINMTDPITCGDAGANRIDLKMTNVDTKLEYLDSFVCDDRAWQAITDGLPSGNYTATVELHTATPAYAGASTLLDSYPMPTTGVYVLTRGQSALDPVNFLVNAFVADWRIYRGNAELSCAQANATTVELAIYFPGMTAPTRYSFDCGDYRQATQGIPMGSYGVDWQAFLVNRQGQDIASTPLYKFDVRTDRMAYLPEISFDVP